MKYCVAICVKFQFLSPNLRSPFLLYFQYVNWKRKYFVTFYKSNISTFGIITNFLPKRPFLHFWREFCRELRVFVVSAYYFLRWRVSKNKQYNRLIRNVSALTQANFCKNWRRNDFVTIVCVCPPCWICTNIFVSEKTVGFWAPASAYYH